MILKADGVLATDKWEDTTMARSNVIENIVLRVNGAALAIGGAFALTRFISSELWKVEATDPPLSSESPSCWPLLRLSPASVPPAERSKSTRQSPFERSRTG